MKIGVRPDFAVIFIETDGADFNARLQGTRVVPKGTGRKMKTAGLEHVASFSFLSLTAACGLAWAVGFTSAPAAAQGTPEQRQACQPDAMRLCSEFIPDVDRITACMVKNRIRLSPACRVVFTTPAHKGKTPKPE
jgi:hypothetical protein